MPIYDLTIYYLQFQKQLVHRQNQVSIIQRSSIQNPESKNNANYSVLNYWPKLITFTENILENERAFYKKH